VEIITQVKTLLFLIMQLPVITHACTVEHQVSAHPISRIHSDRFLISKGFLAVTIPASGMDDSSSRMANHLSFFANKLRELQKRGATSINNFLNLTHLVISADIVRL